MVPFVQAKEWSARLKPFSEAQRSVEAGIDGEARGEIGLTSLGDRRIDPSLGGRVGYAALIGIHIDWPAFGYASRQSRIRR